MNKEKFIGAILKNKKAVIAILAGILVIALIVVVVVLAVNSNNGGEEPTCVTEAGAAGTTSPSETDPVSPSESESATADPPAPNDSESDFQKLTYAEYIALSGSEQEAYFNKFADIDAFFAWYNAAKEEWENSQSGSDIIIGDGTLDFDDIFGPTP